MYLIHSGLRPGYFVSGAKDLFNIYDLLAKLLDLKSNMIRYNKVGIMSILYTKPEYPQVNAKNEIELATALGYFAIDYDWSKSQSPSYIINFSVDNQQLYAFNSLISKTLLFNFYSANLI